MVKRKRTISQLKEQDEEEIECYSR